MILPSLLAAIIPTGFYVTLIYWVDRYEKEPLRLVLAAFLWGAIPSIIAAFLFNTALSIPFYLLSEGFGDFVGAVVIAPPVEESLKGLALLGIFVFWQHELDSPLDGIIYGAMVGMGFAMVENVFYFTRVYKELGLAAWEVNIFMRAFLFGLNHALFSSMTGLGLVAARFARGKITRLAAPIAGWSVAVLLHATHNASASIGGLFCVLLFLSDYGGLLLTFGIIAWALWQESRWIQNYLAEEVEHGLLTAQQWQTASSTWKRAKQSLRQLSTGGFAGYRASIRFYEHCAELAYKKHQFSLFQRGRDQERAERLRTEIAALQQRMT
ncbi:MAG: PrsW family intramembrane metalloprotease [Anaerolineales bacterium]|nr:PrsW family intramembrane metalloprotease [Anaerolineales bacterium]MCB8950908.1 PrsW family intramembrane metalloprotease [Ardenticatenales bacterium]